MSRRPWFGSHRSIAAPLGALTLALVVAATAPAFAQTAPGASRMAVEPHVTVQAGRRMIVVPAQDARAEETRRALEELMRQYPPDLGRVLRLDPSLMGNAAYLEPYPALAAFLESHPAVAHYPDYYLSFAGRTGEPLDPAMQLRMRALDTWRETIGGLGLMMVAVLVVSALLWLVRLFLEHRRWLRETRLQAEMNNRVFERFGSSDQLLAYLQSQPAAAPTVRTSRAESTALVGAPISRILWAVQAGLVLTCGGIGLLVIKHYVIDELGELLLTGGVLAISLGAGFAVASYASYNLSRRFGLVPPPGEAPRPADRA